MHIYTVYCQCTTIFPYRACIRERLFCGAEHADFSLKTGVCSANSSCSEMTVFVLQFSDNELAVRLWVHAAVEMCTRTRVGMPLS